jgi:hypothetical protein
MTAVARSVKAAAAAAEAAVKQGSLFAVWQAESDYQRNIFFTTTHRQISI